VLCCVSLFRDSLLISNRMATGVDVLNPEQETESSDISAQYFCHECDKKFTCDNRSESDDVGVL